MSKIEHTHHHHAHTLDSHRESKLLISLALTTCTLFIEALGGWFSGSLALLADAGHMLVDVFALLLAWAGIHFARLPADEQHSFGYARLEVLAGYSNALVQLILVAWIGVEALMRLWTPEPILSGPMLLVALLGLAVNGIVLGVLNTHDHTDLNTQGARLHVFGDLLGSVGVVIAALAVRYLGWSQADPLISIVVSLLILVSAWSLMRRSSHILLEGIPEGVQMTTLMAAVRRESGVRDVHHVHVWQLAGGRLMATLHVRIDATANSHDVLIAIKRTLRENFAIDHATIQIEAADCPDTTHDCARHEPE